jgi:tRNA (guanine37-N1)-methyltransferase
MVMAAPPVVAAVEDVLGDDLTTTTVIVLSAAGRLFTQEIARELATRPRLALVCGHYEGIDARVTEVLGAEELSVGDYVLTGGELAAMIIVDAVTRLIPGVIDAASIAEESHATALLEYPHYTRPFSFRGRDVPEILLSGHHAQISRWRREQSLLRTARRRPELLSEASLSPADRTLIANDLIEP